MYSSFSFKLIFGLLLNLIFVFPLLAQNIEDKPKASRLYIETDPSTFAFGGYALHFRLQPKNSQHLLLGAGTYGLNMPKFLVDLNAENRNKGWDSRIQTAYAFFAEYYLKAAGEKWFLGLQTGFQNYELENENLPGKQSHYRNLLIMPSVGYTWYPFKIPLYFKPWMGLGYTQKISGEANIENLDYKIAPLTSFMTLHLGYKF